jgi:Xaa-Pro aminopeptidase
MNDSTATTPGAEIEARTGKIQQELARAGVDAAMVLQVSDLFYFAGTIQQSHLYIPVEGEPLLMVRKDYERACSESPLRRIVAIRSPKQLPDLLRQHGYRLPRRLGLELDVLPANQYLGYQSIFGGAEINDISPAIRTVRAVKSEYEIGLIAEAAALSDQVAAGMQEYLAEGVTEIELSGRVEARARKLGHQGIIRMRLWGSEMFYGHLMAGPSAAVPSYLASPTGGASISPAVAQGPSSRSIGRHEPVLLDYVFAHRGYLSDHTRIFALGELPEELMKAHAAMLEVQALVKNAGRPGVPAGELYQLAIDAAADRGYADHFMGVGAQRTRFVGHGIGIELDEYPFLAEGQKLELQEGMIIALEPKLIFPDAGVVGIENTHVVTENGLRQFGQFNEQITIL